MATLQITKQQYKCDLQKCGVAEQRKGEENENVELGVLKGDGDFHSSIGIAVLFVSSVVNRFF